MKQLTIENFKAMLDNALKNIKEREDEFSKLDAVIGDGDRTFARDLHGDGVAVTRQRFVDRVVDYFDDKVVKSSLVRRADIHTGAFADGFQSFEYLNFA